MKSRLYILLALIIGMIMGAGIIWIHCGRLFGRQITGFSYSKVVDDVTTLTMLQNKSITDLVQNKENDLSYTLIGLAGVEDLNSISKDQIRYLKMAANYREKYPFQTGDTNIDQQIDSFLQKIEKIK